MAGSIRVTLELTPEQAARIRHLWSFERALAEANKNPLSGDSQPLARDPAFMEHAWMRTEEGLGEVIRLADGRHLYRYEGARKQGLARPS